mgnify:CR=1 FL=1
MKQCSKSENVLIIDSDYEEADGFIKGVREVTGEEWQVALHENNKIYGWRRYVRFFTVALQTVLSGKKVRRGRRYCAGSSFMELQLHSFSVCFI